MSFSMGRMFIVSFMLGFTSMLIGCATNTSQHSTTIITPIPVASALSVATDPIPNEPLWALYNARNKYFSMEYPANWVVEAAGNSSPADGAIWSITGALSNGTMTNTIVIGRQIMPISANQKLADWVSLYGMGELTKDVLEQHELQINGREAYFLKTSTTFQGLSQTTYIQCKTEVWFIGNLTDKPTEMPELNKVYSHMVNTFMLPCL